MTAPHKVWVKKVGPSWLLSCTSLFLRYVIVLSENQRENSWVIDCARWEFLQFWQPASCNNVTDHQNWNWHIWIICFSMFNYFVQPFEDLCIFNQRWTQKWEILPHICITIITAPCGGEEDRGSHLFESKWGFGPGWGGSKYIYLEFMGLHLLICYIEENKLQKLECDFGYHPEWPGWLEKPRDEVFAL